MRTIIFFISLLLCIFQVSAQRMLPKQKGFELGYGVLSKDDIADNYYINIGLTINTKKGNYQLLSLEYNREQYLYKSAKIPVETYSLEGGYSFQIFSDRTKSVALNAGISGVIGYETLNHGNELLYDGATIINESSFVYGLRGRLSLETYLSDRLVFVIQGRGKMFWEMSRHQFRPSLGIGLRYNFK